MGVRLCLGTESKDISDGAIAQKIDICITACGDKESTHWIRIVLW